ncbi:MAG: hypothetical protein P1V97_19750 [Planctomycetota bacterium]|nr:hypothetical protein [Planctomycetota bacterium]
MKHRTQLIYLASLAVLCLSISCKAEKPKLSPEEQLKQFKAQFKKKHESCLIHIRGLGISTLLYSQDYKFLPHMQPLTAPSKAEDASKIVESLMFFKYVDSDHPEVFTCPSSPEKALVVSQKVVDNPRLFKLDAPEGYADTVKPILRKGGGRSAYQSEALSYVFAKKAIPQKTASKTTIVAADKFPYHLDDQGQRGYHVLYGDGHASFVLLSNKAELKRMNDALHIAKTDSPKYKKFMETFVKDQEAQITKLAGSLDKFFGKAPEAKDKAKGDKEKK